MGDAPSLPQVLVVEDNQDLREALCELLSLEGYRPKGCTSGEAAWMQLANGLRPSAMVVDLALRRMSGRELLRLLRGTEWGRQIPVLLLSGWERLEQFLDYADAVLRKDAETVSIIRTVNRLATHGRLPGALDGARFERRPPQRIEPTGSAALREAALCDRHPG